MATGVCRSAHKAAISPYSIAVAAEAVVAEATTVMRAAASMTMNRVTVRIGNPPYMRLLLRHSSPHSIWMGFVLIAPLGFPRSARIAPSSSAYFVVASRR